MCPCLEARKRKNLRENDPDPSQHWTNNPAPKDRRIRDWRYWQAGLPTKDEVAGSSISGIITNVLKNILASGRNEQAILGTSSAV